MDIQQAEESVVSAKAKVDLDRQSDVSTGNCCHTNSDYERHRKYVQYALEELSPKLYEAEFELQRMDFEIMALLERNYTFLYIERIADYSKKSMGQREARSCNHKRHKIKGSAVLSGQTETSIKRMIDQDIFPTPHSNEYCVDGSLDTDVNELVGQKTLSLIEREGDLDKVQNEVTIGDCSPVVVQARSQNIEVGNIWTTDDLRSGINPRNQDVKDVNEGVLEYSQETEMAADGWYRKIAQGSLNSLKNTAVVSCLLKSIGGATSGKVLFLPLMFVSLSGAEVVERLKHTLKINNRSMLYLKDNLSRRVDIWIWTEDMMVNHTRLTSPLILYSSLQTCNDTKCAVHPNGHHCIDKTYEKEIKVQFVPIYGPTKTAKISEVESEENLPSKIPAYKFYNIDPLLSVCQVELRRIALKIEEIKALLERNYSFLFIANSLSLMEGDPNVCHATKAVTKNCKDKHLQPHYSRESMSQREAMCRNHKRHRTKCSAVLSGQTETSVKRVKRKTVNTDVQIQRKLSNLFHTSSYDDTCILLSLLPSECTIVHDIFPTSLSNDFCFFHVSIDTDGHELASKKIFSLIEREGDLDKVQNEVTSRLDIPFTRNRTTIKTIGDCSPVVVQDRSQNIEVGNIWTTDDLRSGTNPRGQDTKEGNIVTLDYSQQSKTLADGRNRYSEHGILNSLVLMFVCSSGAEEVEWLKTEQNNVLKINRSMPYLKDNLSRRVDIWIWTEDMTVNHTRLASPLILYSSLQTCNDTKCAVHPNGHHDIDKTYEKEIKVQFVPIYGPTKTAKISEVDSEENLPSKIPANKSILQIIHDIDTLLSVCQEISTGFILNTVGIECDFEVEQRFITIFLPAEHETFVKMNDGYLFVDNPECLNWKRKYKTEWGMTDFYKTRNKSKSNSQDKERRVQIRESTHLQMRKDIDDQRNHQGILFIWFAASYCVFLVLVFVMFQMERQRLKRTLVVDSLDRLCEQLKNDTKDEQSICTFKQIPEVFENDAVKKVIENKEICSIKSSNDFNASDDISGRFSPQETIIKRFRYLNVANKSKETFLSVIFSSLDQLDGLDDELSFAARGSKITTRSTSNSILQNQFPSGCSFGRLRRRNHTKQIRKTHDLRDNEEQCGNRGPCEKANIVMKLVKISRDMPNTRRCQQTLLKIFHNDVFMRQEIMKCMRMRPELRNFELLNLLVIQLSYKEMVVEKRNLRTNINDMQFKTILHVMYSGFKKHGAFHGRSQRKPLISKAGTSEKSDGPVKSLEQRVLKQDEFEINRETEELHCGNVCSLQTTQSIWMERVRLLETPPPATATSDCTENLTTDAHSTDRLQLATLDQSDEDLIPNTSGEVDYNQFKSPIPCTEPNLNEHKHNRIIDDRQQNTSLLEKSKSFFKKNDKTENDGISIIRELTWLPFDTLPPPCLEQRDLTVANVTFTTIDTVFSQLGQGITPGPATTMKFELLRLCTLRNYPKENKPYLTRLAATGFYYAANGDEVVCYCCAVRRNNWIADEDPEIVHKRLSPRCSFFLRNEHVNFPVPRMGSETSAKFAFLEEFIAPILDGDFIKQADGSSQSRRDRNGTPTISTANARANTSSLGIETSSAKHPHYAVKAVRLNSFQGWPSSSLQDPRALAEAGFYFAGIGDCVRCFYCGIGLRHWTEEDDPNIEHARWSEHCTYLRQYKGEEFVNLVQMAVQYTQDEQSSQPGSQPNEEVTRILMTDAAQSVVEMGYDARLIKRAIDALLKENGRTGMTAERIMEKVLTLEEKECEEQKCGMQNTDKDKTNIDTQSKPRNSTPVSNASVACSRNAVQGASMRATGTMGVAEAREDQRQNPRKIKAENEKLKEQTLCKICLDRNVCVVFLPCGHLVTCADCAPALRKCPICRSIIKGTVKTYMS